MKANLRFHQGRILLNNISATAERGLLKPLSRHREHFWVVERFFLSLFCLTLLTHADGALVLPEAFHTTKWTAITNIFDLKTEYLSMQAKGTL